MTHEIIKMAKQAGAKYYGTGEEGVTALMLRDEAIEAFAKLVAAREREKIAQRLEEFELKFTADVIRAEGEA